MHRNPVLVNVSLILVSYKVFFADPVTCSYWLYSEIKHLLLLRSPMLGLHHHLVFWLEVLPFSHSSVFLKYFWYQSFLNDVENLEIFLVVGFLGEITLWLSLYDKMLAAQPMFCKTTSFASMLNVTEIKSNYFLLVLYLWV